MRNCSNFQQGLLIRRSRVRAPAPSLKLIFHSGEESSPLFFFGGLNLVFESKCQRVAVQAFWLAFERFDSWATEKSFRLSRVKLLSRRPEKQPGCDARPNSGQSDFNEFGIAPSPVGRQRNSGFESSFSPGFFSTREVSTCR